MKQEIDYAQFDAVDIRIGRVIAALAPDWSNKLLQFTVDFGAEIGERTILSGVKQWCEPDVFLGNCYLFVVNLAPRKMGDGVSEGMMLMADSTEKPILLPVNNTIEPGLSIR